MGFFDRNRKALAARGIDPARLPAGQYTTDRFPVLHVGDVPAFGDLSGWSLRIFGLVEREVTLSWADLQALPHVNETVDIHCVTKWSKFDTEWTGVRLADLLGLAGPLPDAAALMQHAEYGYSSNVPLADALRPESLLADGYDGRPLDPRHGYPARTFIPHLYLWKSVKWVRGLEVLAEDAPGFWERNGYHMYGDPFLEQRFS
jgi:DMSO/TMAO reductase YedYZ molybdopterin-dependent catalytic subunit